MHLSQPESEVARASCSPRETPEPDTAEQQPERNYGYVPMSPSEIFQCRDNMMLHDVLAETPAEYADILSDEFFWKGLSWLSVAKCIHVQMQHWFDNCWAVPSKLRLRLKELAMQQHEQGAGRVETVADLQNVLLARGHREKLQAISRLD